MKIAMRLFFATALLVAGFAAGFPVGQSAGFDSGSEWALHQATLVAQEAGLTMPVTYDNGHFLIIMTQPHHLYRRAWRLADLFEKDMTDPYADVSNGNEPLRLAGNAPPDK